MHTNKEFLINEVKKVKLDKPVMFEGLPGMGNVGKITVDFMIDSLKAEKIIEIYANYFNHCVFMQEDGSAKLPSIDVYHKKISGKDYVFVTGDVQPVDERGCYDFCFSLVSWFKNLNGKEIITIGGIGLEDTPKNPKVFLSSTDKKIISRFKDKEVNTNAYTFVGPIMGVSGVLIGVSRLLGVNSATILAETNGNPEFLGIKGSKKVLAIIENKMKLGLDIKGLEKEIKVIEKEIRGKMEKELKVLNEEENGKFSTNYIG